MRPAAETKVLERSCGKRQRLGLSPASGWVSVAPILNDIRALVRVDPHQGPGAGRASGLLATRIGMASSGNAIDAEMTEQPEAVKLYASEDYVEIGSVCPSIGGVWPLDEAFKRIKMILEGSAELQRADSERPMQEGRLLDVKRDCMTLRMA